MNAYEVPLSGTGPDGRAFGHGVILVPSDPSVDTAIKTHG